MKLFNISAIIGLSLLFFYQFAMAQNRIIMLDGTSSAGKSSIAQKLLPLLHGQTEIVSYDKVLDEVIKDNQELENNLEGMENRIEITMYAKIRKLYTDGKNVIIDSLISREDEIELFLKILHDLPIFMVLVYCPLEQLFQHLAERNSLSDENEHRAIDVPFGQFFQMYKPKGMSSDDVVVDALKKSQVTWVAETLKKTAKKKENNPQVLNDFFELIDGRASEIYKKFGLDKYDEVEITTQVVHDAIANTGTNTAAECAQAIFQWLESKIKPSAIQQNYEKLKS